jgi:ketosteroid isomerase-like protein
MRNVLFVLITLFLVACNEKMEEQVVPDPSEIDEVMNAWHKAVAEVDSTEFFGLMTEDAVYIGTDPEEYWTKKEFMEFALPIFRQGRSWDFTPYDRHVYFNADGNLAWGDELLQTWMGACRGSMVLEKQETGWKISHYHLSIAVPNDITDGYLKLLREGGFTIKER